MKQRRGGGLGFAITFVLAGCGASTNSGTGEGTGPAPGPMEMPAAPATHATGEVSPWETSAAMPVPRGNHCSVAANGFLVVIGGNYKPQGKTDFVNIADVHVARIAADGSLGAWKLAGKTPSPVNSCTAASDGKDVFLVDGIFDDDNAASKVRRAKLSEAGDLGDWQELGALPKDVRVLYSNATVTNGSLQAFYAKLPDAGDGVALASAPVAGDGLGAWRVATWLTGFRGHPEYAFATVGGASYVYAFGGYASGASMVLADGAGALIGDSGMPGKSFTVHALPKPTSSGQAIAIDDWVFVVGGKDQVLTGAGRPDVFAAKIGAGGAIDAWKSASSMPQGRTSHSLAASGDFLYVTGGGFDAGGLDTVFRARVRFPTDAR